MNFPKLIPIFPLSNFIMFPKTTVPLNIFEPRYIDMINDSMKSEKFIGMIQPKSFQDKKNIIPELTITEIDLLKQQLRNCFNPRAGTQIDGDEEVQIFTKVDRNANIIKETVKIISTNVSKSNPYYEAITESAVATLYNPMCSKLKLPLEKYESWKDLKITIDYSWVN